jgi:hypothetical protein
MGIALQIALFLASVSVVVLVAFLVPTLLGLRNQVNELKSDVKLCVQDARVLMQNANQLTSQAQRQLNETEQVLRVVRGWSERADRLVHQAGDIIEGPLLTGARILTGIGKLFYDWLQNDRETAGKPCCTSSQKGKHYEQT